MTYRPYKPSQFFFLEELRSNFINGWRNIQNRRENNGEDGTLGEGERDGSREVGVGERSRELTRCDGGMGNRGKLPRRGQKFHMKIGQELLASYSLQRSVERS